MCSGYVKVPGESCSWFLKSPEKSEEEDLKLAISESVFRRAESGISNSRYSHQSRLSSIFNHSQSDPPLFCPCFHPLESSILGDEYNHPSITLAQSHPSFQRRWNALCLDPLHRSTCYYLLTDSKSLLPAILRCCESLITLRAYHYPERPTTGHAVSFSFAHTEHALLFCQYGPSTTTCAHDCEEFL